MLLSVTRQLLHAKSTLHMTQSQAAFLLPGSQSSAEQEQRLQRVRVALALVDSPMGVLQALIPTKVCAAL